jgi:hypothetical protein
VIFLQIVARGYLLLFVMCSRATIFSPPLPAMPLVLAIVGTQVLAVLICGSGWFVPAIPWSVIGLVWVCMLVWMVVLGVVDPALYRRLREGDAGPNWYRRFRMGLRNDYPPRAIGHIEALVAAVERVLDAAQPLMGTKVSKCPLAALVSRVHAALFRRFLIGSSLRCQVISLT